MGRLTVLALRLVLGVLFAGSLFVQTVVVAVNAVELDADLAEMRHPYLLITFLVLGLVTFQVVLVCVWRLVTMVRRGTVFSHTAFRYVDVVIGAIVAAALLMAVLAAVQAPGEDLSPGMVLMLGGAVLAVLGVALIVLVLRMLLAQAVARDAQAAHLEAELEEVV
ncbi:DUF2975 domain-containing protein [Phytohabitans sp. ZYX-F-186]|uniref:DUF2975 domain-containing protein n=1 Tax=Phytohabitans maris TaxID=3071409 RepID=A0ABU0ZGJ7_9ACTN|nr:DUF2975 domain-containing protein [Phytohabitans sp. ZYX-F-186]MDQ7905529.1 DUF2975 domain-containing protein [Phytohabitans sp. ZYX-F-186]